MEPKKNYLMVGVFVVLLALGMMGFVVWLVGHNNQGDYTTYQTFASESVNGLTVGSTVRYRGVEVGKVTKVEIAKSNPAKIRIEMDILETTPITTSTIAVLQLQGITGISYIELKGRVAKGQPPIQTVGNNKIPIIPSAPSEFRQIVDTVPAMLQKFTELADKLGQFASEDNKNRFDTILRNMEKFSTDVGGEDGSGQSLIGELQAATKEMGKAAAAISEIANNSKDDTKRILDATAQTIDKIGKLTDSTGQLTGKTYADLHQLLLELKKTAREFQSLSRSLKENPSQIIVPARNDGVRVP